MMLTPTRRATALVGAISLMLMLFSTPAAGADPDDPIAIPDHNLRACINHKLDAGRAPDQSVTEAEAESIEVFSCTSAGVSDLTGLEHFTNLKGLTLSGNAITGLGPLGGMASLGSLYLTGNEISDIGPLSGLSTLTAVNLSHNKIVDASPLATPRPLGPSLGFLNLDANHIVDVSPLADFASFASVLNQTVDLGAVEIGAPKSNPVVGFIGQPVALSDRYDPDSDNPDGPAPVDPSDVDDLPAGDSDGEAGVDVGVGAEGASAGADETGTPTLPRTGWNPAVALLPAVMLLAGGGLTVRLALRLSRPDTK